MNIEQMHIGVKVQFRKPNSNLLDKEIYTIISINNNDWGACNCLLNGPNGNVYTNNAAIEIAKEEKPSKRQLSIFDFLEG